MSIRTDPQLEMFGPRPAVQATKFSDHDLPRSAQELIAAIGFESAMKLMVALPGMDFVVPQRLADGVVCDMLVDAIGHNATEQLLKWGAGSHLYVPACHRALIAARDREIIRRIDAGEHVYTVCRAFKMTRRHLFRVLKRPL